MIYQCIDGGLDGTCVGLSDPVQGCDLCVSSVCHLL